MASRKPKQYVVVVYHGGDFLARFRMIPVREETEVEYTFLTGLKVNAMLVALLQPVCALCNEMYKEDALRLMKNIDNDRADDEYAEGQRSNGELPF